jgi:hypothetical protein
MTPRVLDARPARAGVARTAAKVGAVAGAIVALVGVLHAPFARGLLLRIGGCPMAGARMTPVEMDAARRIAVAADPATAMAGARPALGFALDESSAADVDAWARRVGASCRDVHPGLVKCESVPAAALGRADVEGRIDELAIGFDRRGHVVNVTTLRTHLGAEQASRSADDIVASLQRALGAASRTGGTFAKDQLAKAGAASAAAVSYRYRDYVADVTALNLGSDGLVLREHYMSAND